MIGSDGSGERLLATAGIIRSPIWDLTGRLIAFQTQEKEDRYLHVVSVEDGRVRDIEGPEVRGELMAWSPDGRWLAQVSGCRADPKPHELARLPTRWVPAHRGIEPSSTSLDGDIAVRASTTSLPSGPLRVENVGVSRGGHRILNRVELTLYPGEMCALIGPSGAGKSTLIKVLLGLWDPDEGSVSMGSLSVRELGPVGYVPQDDALHRGLTVQRELAYAAELRMPGTSAEARGARVAEVLDQVGLGDRSGVRIRRLSGGQRKRVSVALELLTGPPMLILDEPTSGLDPGLEARTMTLLDQVAEAGQIVLVATHTMESIELAEALCVLVGGHVAFFGPPRDALSYFRVDRYAELFRQLEKQSPSAWHLTARADPDQRAFLLRSGP